MPFLGSQPIDQYQSLAKQTITGDGSTSYTLNRSVTNAYDMEVFINNVRQEPDTSYSASGNTITFTAAVTASDSCYLIYQGQAVGSINPPANSVGTSQVANNSITTAHMHTSYALPAQSSALDITTTTHANASVFKSTGHTQVMLQDTDATANYRFWGLQNSGGDFNILKCNDDRASGFVTPLTITQHGAIQMPTMPFFATRWNYGSAGGLDHASGSHLTTHWHTPHVNTGNDFNNTQGRFTAPFAGSYHFEFHDNIYRASDGNVYLEWYKNGSSTTGTNGGRMYSWIKGGQWFNISGFVVINLGASDYVDLYVSGGPARLDGNAYGQYSGRCLHAT